MVSSVCGGLNQIAPQVLQVTVRCPERPGAHEHGDQSTSTFGAVSRCPLAQMFGNHPADPFERMFE
jgi:hypothetical protein